MGAQGGVNSFNKGLNKDASIVNQPEGSYRDALNVTLLNDNGEFGALSNEKGTIETFDLPDGYQVIGKTVVDDAVVYCLVNPVSNLSQIGIYQNGVYTKKVPVVGEDNQLGFTIDNPVDIVGKKMFNGNIIVYFTDNNEPFSSINLDNPPTNIAKGKGIIPEINLPTITYDSIISGGNLNGGTYQFVVRYLNNELVPTVATLPTNPIPIIGYATTDYTKIEGAAYNKKVNKAIKLNITGLDTDYPYFELIAIGYEGATSTPYAHIVSTYDIVSSSQTIIYAGKDEDSVDILPEEALAEPITYSLAKCIEQKDSRLLLSNLTETKSRYAATLQEVANNIVIKYSIVTHSLNYYTYELNSANNKTYRRGEVYSFGMGVTFKDGSKSYVYHIPAPTAVGVAGEIAQEANTTTKVLGTYLSEDLYPVDGEYPIGNIRHHVMPTLEQEPIYNAGGSSTTTFRRLSLDFTNVVLPADLKNQIQSITFYREPRNTIEKKSKLSQGVVTNIYLGATDYESNEDANDYASLTIRRGDAASGSFHFRKNLGFFNMQLNTYYNIYGYLANLFNNHKTYLEGAKKQWSTHNGCYYSVKTLDETIYDDRADTTTAFNSPLDQADEQRYQNFYQEMRASKLCYMSPETLLSDGVFLDANSLQGAVLKKTLSFTTLSTAALKLTVFDRKNFVTKQVNHIAYQGNFNIGYELDEPLVFHNIPQTILESQYVNNGERVKLPGLPTYQFDNDYSGKFLYLKLSGDHTQNANTIGNVINMDFPTAIIDATLNVVDETLSIWKDVGPEGASIGTPGSLNNFIDLYEIENKIRNQYGRIETSQYAPIITSININSTTFVNILGGDTFVTRYSLNHKTFVNRYFPFYKTVRSGSASYKFFEESWKDSDSNRAFVSTSIHKNIYSPETYPGYTFNTGLTYIVESDINCYYRFKGEDGIPYYPNATIDEVWNSLPNQEENRNYNVQYSKDNTINANLVSRPIFDDAIERYPTRTIYSERDSEDSKVDYYQIFKQESKYDLPEDTGEIVDTFIWNNEFYSHTPKSLWRNYFNSVTREANSVGEIVLGTGDAFKLPAQKVITSTGGYGGTTSQFGNVITPFGYFFVDVLQHKVFKLSNSLEEISLQGLNQYFDSNIVETNDNPFHPTTPRGFTMGWDNDFKRILLTHHKAVDSFTISYYPMLNAWGSFHSYIPNVYIEQDRVLYSIINVNTTGAIHHTHNIGAYGVYHNNPIQPSTITIVSNHNASAEKAFDNFMIHSRSYSPGFEYLDMFNTIQCVTPYLDSQELTINTTNDWNPTIANNEILCRWKKSHFQIAIPRDNQEVNLNTADGWKDASRMKGKYLQTTFKYNNLNNREFIVNFIQYLYRVIAR